MKYDRVVRMPLLVEMACPVCGKEVRGHSLYTVEGHSPWRCWECVRKLARQIVALRNRADDEDNSAARQPRGY
jgi:transposase-like protein